MGVASFTGESVETKRTGGQVYYLMSPRCVAIMFKVHDLDETLEKEETIVSINVNRKPDFRSCRNIGKVGLDRFEHTPVIPDWDRRRSMPVSGSFELAGLVIRNDVPTNFHAPKVYGLVSRYGHSDEYQYGVLLGRDTVEHISQELELPNPYTA